MQLLALSLAIRCVIRGASHGRTVIAYFELRCYLVRTERWSYRTVFGSTSRRIERWGVTQSDDTTTYVLAFARQRRGNAVEPVRLTKGQRAQKGSTPLN